MEKIALQSELRLNKNKKKGGVKENCKYTYVYYHVNSRMIATFPDDPFLCHPRLMGALEKFYIWNPVLPWDVAMDRPSSFSQPV